MKNRRGDFLWGLALLAWVLVLAIPSARTVFIAVTDAHPYLGGFAKFSILATMGDLLGARILNNKWIIPKGVIYKALVWGILGMVITLFFTVYIGGVGAAQAAGRLPFAKSTLAVDFFGSLIMNTTFGPMMYIYHKFGDLFIDMKYEHPNKKITVNEMVNRVDWNTMVGFSWMKTCTFIWIPCHTMVFLLPVQYRVLASAFLSILLGIIVALSKKGAKESVRTLKSA